MFSCNFFLFPTFWFPIIILVLSFHPFYAAYLLSLASPVQLPVYDCSLRFCLCLVPCGCVLFFCDYCICGTENCRITVLFYSIYTIPGDAPKTSEFKPSQIKLLEMSISNMYILFLIFKVGKCVLLHWVKWRINISLYADESRECESGIIVYRDTKLDWGSSWCTKKQLNNRKQIFSL